MKLVKSAQVYPELNQRGFVQIIITVIIALAIGAGAMFAYQKYAQKPVPSPSPTSSSTNTQTQTTNKNSPSPATSDETVNWKTYTSNKLGFSLKYPQGWYPPSEDSSGITFSTEEVPHTSFSTFLSIKNMYAFGTDPDETKIFEELYSAKDQTNLASSYKNIATGATVTKIGNLKINGLQAIKIFEKPGPEFPAPFYAIRVHINKLNKIWTISNIGSTEKEAVDRQKIFDQVLSTFKFTQ